MLERSKKLSKTRLNQLHTYFEHIGYEFEGSIETLKPTLELLQTLHEKHVLSIPFENLSIHLGQSISIDIDSIYDKLFSENKEGYSRGGYCHEMNGWLFTVLKDLGFTVELHLADLPLKNASFRGEPSHALLVVTIENQQYLADVGFGRNGLIHPLLLDKTQPQVQTIHKVSFQTRFQPEDGFYYYSVHYAGEFHPEYRFNLSHPIQQLSDLQIQSDKISKDATSPITTMILISKPIISVDEISLEKKLGRMTLQNNKLLTIETGKDNKEDYINHIESYLEILKEFGIILTLEEIESFTKKMRFDRSHEKTSPSDLRRYNYFLSEELMFYQFDRDTFNNLVKNPSASGDLPDILKKSFYQTIELNLRNGKNGFQRENLWLLTPKQLKKIARLFPEYEAILIDKKIIDNDLQFLIDTQPGSIYFPSLTKVKYSPENGFQYPPSEHLDTSLLASEAWLYDLGTGYYGKTGSFGQWAKATKEAGRSFSKLNGIVSIVRDDCGLVSESHIFHGIPLAGSLRDGKKIIEVIPENEQFSLAQAALLSSETRIDNNESELFAKLETALKTNNFKNEFGYQKIIYIARAKIFNCEIRCQFDPALHYSHASDPIYEPASKKLQHKFALKDNIELVVIGKWDDTLGVNGGLLDTDDHRHGISRCVYKSAKKLSAQLQSENRSISEEDREKFSLTLQSNSKTDELWCGHLITTNARFELVKLLGFASLEHTYQIHSDGRPAGLIHSLQKEPSETTPFKFHEANTQFGFLASASKGKEKSSFSKASAHVATPQSDNKGLSL